MNHLDRDELLRDMNWLTGLARSLVCDPSRAEDVVQETWLKATERRSRGGAVHRSWLSRVLRNFIYRAHRDESARRRRERGAARREAVVESPEDVVEQAELGRRILDLVLSSDEPYRSTLLLRFFKGMSTRDVAARQSVDVTTVRWRLRKALADLRTGLNESHDERRESWKVVLLPLVGLSSAREATRARQWSGIANFTLTRNVVAAASVIVVAGTVLSVAVLLSERRAAAVVESIRELGGRVQRNEDGEVTEVHLSGPGVESSDLAPLTELPSLRRLSLYRTKVNDGGLEEIARLTDLRWLNLSHTAVTDDGLAALAELRNLETLILYETAVTETCAAQLGRLPRLRSLNIRNTRWNVAGVSRLGRIGSLETLSLSFSPTTEALRSLPSLRRLELSNVSASRVEAIRRRFPALEVVALPGRGGT